MATPKFAMKNVVSSWVETPLATPTKIEGNGSAGGMCGLPTGEIITQIMIECMHKLTNEFWSAFCPPRRIRNAALGYAYAVGARGARGN